MTGPGDSDESQIDVERQRAELAETFEELTHRVDVPARTKVAVHEKSDAAVELARRRAPALAVVAGVGVVLIFLGAVRRRRRRRH
ncbi:DUF3618 domain-containing protein [Prescottella equi]|uniref:DUF3618 domain-containing protein n=1 Tax=Rhodococcus hoagii TaxID=43767 RepID=A0AAP2F3K4_RHOHA|nr:DUF3618 domain-containing protein [Prescottella equi]AVP66740.1 DUF3618 domain-containing protein [Prescottella equi]MBM4627305.1 DUF3618 domain-containing protein [Prescottella equi]MBM4733797.1 DUF3618 domain-containing protein [Prescottella equi]NKR51630.1 DUF3618 domain-containing protein [Prescottella equi]ORL97988.1 hypothetical protein A5N73_20370 [Prescottella equi]